MRVVVSVVIGFALALSTLGGGSRAAAGGMLPACAICTCQNEAVLCVGTSPTMEELEEQGPCGGICSTVDSSFQSLTIVDAPCEDLPTCDHAYAPAASPLWLGGGAFALLLLSSVTLRRARLRGTLS